ncbi:transglycosylase SLT domain-containing protein [Cellvibrio sp. BR]|jgi:soluble lytic murein transglycosylase|uniref:transglycosylase SLT domain-containing protein n=1 Tax=Cellvibrio sp. BR TaxID=1134474 RepID=UPI0002DE1A05|nr:transglycosylase SLT domain-containing protein [Cellvibrio sp. BR]
MRFSKILWPLSLSASVLIGSMTLSIASTASAATPATTKQTGKSDARLVERQQYDRAQKALNSKSMAEYRQLVKKLQNYPLVPYLEYQDLSERLITLPKTEVERFFNRYPDSFLAERLTHRWLRTLAQRERWTDYRQFYDARLTDPELACLNLRARLATGDKTALDEVGALWNIEKAQSKACDPVFAEWRKAGRMTPELIWQRHLKVLKAGNNGMASYLSNLLPATEKPLALLLQQVNTNPRLLKQTSKFAKQSPQMKTVILHGLEKLARTNAKEALSLWRIYDAQQLFSDDDRNAIKYQIALRLLYQDHDAEAEKLVASTPNLNSIDLLEWLLRESLRKQNWEQVNEWLTRLPEDARATERWRYWQARTMEELGIKEINGETPMAIYNTVAPARSFYGFLAADKTGINYHLLDRPVVVSDEQVRAVENSQGMLRAREFLDRGNLSAATREFFYSARRMKPEQAAIAGRLAERWGWHRHGIQVMAEAQLWDELQVRFPIVYQDHVTKAAKQTSVNPLLIFAVARQESAFMHDAKSPAGAVGLMQLLPSTAKQTAQKSGMSFNAQDLIKPDKNIALGSRYLDYLLGVFDGNRILAAAAYNAGPSRVRQWMNKEKNAQLPYDVWIETIPFKETRGYVQNILSFSVIYAYRLGQETKFVTAEEANRTL